MNTLPCEVQAECQNSLLELGESRAHCPMCKWALDNGGNLNYWNPKTPGRKHPAAIRADLERKVARKQRKAEARKARDPRRQYYSKRAARAEEQTNRSLSGFVRPTKNSGRSNKDGDHRGFFASTVARSQLTLDTKLQSNAEHPRVSLEELDKVRADATRAGTLAGGLVLRNCYGRAVVVFAEEDFRALFV